jgi:hypothetical protein
MLLFLLHYVWVFSTILHGLLVCPALSVIGQPRANGECEFCKDTNDAQTAEDLFKSWSLLDLTRKGNMDFVIACEQQSKVEIDGYQVKNSIVRKIHIPRPYRRAKPS